MAETSQIMMESRKHKISILPFFILIQGGLVMPFFESKEQMIDVFNEFWKRALEEKEVMEKLKKSGLVIRFDIDQPTIQITINLRDETPDGSYGSIDFDSEVEPDLKVWSTSETTNKFWQGKLNATIAMARGKVKIDGPIAKALGLLSKIKPLYKIFPEVLKDKGLDNMIL
jgi:putative sterol carrier protein